MRHCSEFASETIDIKWCFCYGLMAKEAQKQFRIYLESGRRKNDAGPQRELRKYQKHAGSCSTVGVR